VSYRNGTCRSNQSDAAKQLKALLSLHQPATDLGLSSPSATPNCCVLLLLLLLQRQTETVTSTVCLPSFVRLIGVHSFAGVLYGDVSMFSDSLDLQGTVSVNDAAVMRSVLTRRVVSTAL